MNMVVKKDFDKLNLKEIEEQIQIRKDLLKQMVGTLYPLILKNEIVELSRLLFELPDNLFEVE